MMDASKLEADGWERVQANSFSAKIGQTWTKGKSPEIVVGLIPDKDATNENLGIVHGGALMTFADIAFGIGVTSALGHAYCVTVQLQFQFVSVGQADSFVTCKPEIVRRTRQLVFVRGILEADGRTIGSADAIFKVLEVPEADKLRVRTH